MNAAPLADLDAVVVGAGIGGLAAALALARGGARVRVFEQAAALGEAGAGLSLSPNAVKGLRCLGLEPALARVADAPPVQRTRHFVTGATLIEIDRADTPARYGAPYYQLHRADLHALLRAAVEDHVPGAIHTGRPLTGLVEHAAGVELRFATGGAETADLVVAADGLRSRVREAHFGATAPEFTGYVAWRGLVPAELLGAFAPGSSVFAGPGRLFVHYPVRHGRLRNFVAFARTGEWTPESWSEPATVASFAPVFADFHAEARAIIAATPGGRCHRWGLFARPPVPRWVSDRVALLGDAAHPMLPWFGQGAATAIEDAVVIGRALAAAATPAEGLARYARARRARLELIYEESLLGGERLAGDETDALAARPPRTEDSLGISSYDPATAPV